LDEARTNYRAEKSQNGNFFMLWGTKRGGRGEKKRGKKGERRKRKRGKEEKNDKRRLV
jgi:hypothetical protein